jgi:phasin family protein
MEVIMFPLSQTATPAVQDYLRCQFSLVNDMSKMLFSTAQRVNELNVQVAKTVLDETIQTTREVLTAQDPLEALSVATGQMQPAAERVRAYQQHLTNIAAGAQVELTKTVESRVPETTRTAAAVADEVTRRTAEETQKAAERQRAAMERVTNPVRGSSSANKGSAPGAQPGTRNA